MSEQKFNNELLMSFGKLESAIQNIDKRLDKQEKNMETQQQMLYKLIENEQVLNHLVEDYKEIKIQMKEMEEEYKKKIDSINSKVSENEKVVKNIKWAFGIFTTILTSVVGFGLKDHFFGK